MKSRNKKRLLALVLCMVVAISNSSFIFASETGQTEYPQEAEVQTQDEAVANDMDVAAYAADEGQAVAEEQPAAVEQVAAEPETTAENQAAQPVAEAPAAEQPTTEAPAAQEPAAAPTEETAPASENATAETPEEDATQAEAENQQLTWSQAVGNTTVNVTAEAGALPADAQLSVTEITAEDEVKEIEKAVEEKAIEEQFSIKNIFSYDIKFLVNGSEVQPTTPVQVSVDTPEITSSENAAVLHVDDNNVAKDMNGAVDGEGKVVFDAPHFSTFVIVQKGEPKVNVTIEYYDDSQSSKPKIYASKKELSPGESISNYDIADNWDFRWAEKITAGEKPENIQSLDALNNNKITRDCTIKVYYTPKNEPITGSTKFYDYTVKAGEENGKYRSFNELKNGKSPATDINNKNEKLIAGSNDPNSHHNYPEYQKYKISLRDSEGKDKDANRYTEGDYTIPGLLEKIDGDGDVIFKYAEPGFFVDEDASYITPGNEKRYLRKVYWNYTLEFDRSGDTYTLSNVQDGNGKRVANAGSGFYPLDDVKPSYEASEANRNNFFGMRYDVTFKIGDYVGPLDYEFKGDDDLWVVLDNEKIVIDLGGIHQVATGKVNLWEYIGEAANLSDEEKQKNHTLTILYMERGAVESNCQMKFTLPNASIVQVTQEPLANFSFQKVNTNKVALPGAKFSLTNNSDSAKVYEATSDSNGTVLFSDLREGTYTLEETKAPEGYSLSNETWIVKVSKTGDSAVAKLYKSDETTPVQLINGVYNIVNQTQQEIIKSSMEHSKTATVKNWDERTYNINIKAASTSTSETTSTQKPVADIMLVLDVSGSMKEEIVTYTYVAMNTEEGRNGLDKKKTYYLESNGDYKPLRYYKDRVFWGPGWYVGTYGTTSADQYNAECKIYTASTTTRLDALKNSVNQFIDDTEAKSPNSKIGITAFSSAGYGDHGSTMDLTEVGVSDNAQDLKKFVNELDAEGGTDPGVGLSNAKTKLDAVVNDGKTKCVVLFTDGEPTGEGSRWDETAQKSAEDKAKSLRDAGYTVYTIGFDLNDRSKTFLAGGTYNETKYPGIASPGCAKVADDAASLGEIFKEIQNTITNDIDIVGATVTDVIDPRFVIVKDDGTAIKNEDLAGKTITLNNGGVVSLDENGNQVVTWTDQTIPNKKKGEWSNTITVKAKDDYIGGNNVPTNVTPDSKITTGYGEVVLQQPRVNVKSELKVKDKTVTIYKGDRLPDTNTVLNEMFDLRGNTNKYSVPENSFTTEWYSDPNDDTSKVTNLTADKDKYYLKVRYNAGAPTTDSTENTNDNIAGGEDHIVEAVNEKDSTKPYGIYTIKVVSGEIQITKELKSSLETDCTFYFSIKDESGKEIKKVSIKIPARSTKATFDGEDLKNLSRGTYTISEVDSDGYVLTDYKIDDSTNCRNTRNEKQESVTFKLGYENTDDSEDVDVIKNYTYVQKSGGTVGSVTFTNEKATAVWDIVKVSTSGNQVHLPGAEFDLKKDGKVVYTGTSNNDGKIIWMKDGEVVSSLEKGEYSLKETKAPTGYVLSNEEWTIKITKGGHLVSYTTNKAGSKIDEITESDGTLHLYFKNEVVYDLPSTGHFGIFNILMSGILLMFAGILIIYKMKGKGVLKK